MIEWGKFVIIITLSISFILLVEKLLLERIRRPIYERVFNSLYNWWIKVEEMKISELSRNISSRLLRILSSKRNGRFYSFSRFLVIACVIGYLASVFYQTTVIFTRYTNDPDIIKSFLLNHPEYIKNITEGYLLVPNYSRVFYPFIFIFSLIRSLFNRFVLIAIPVAIPFYCLTLYMLKRTLQRVLNHRIFIQILSVSGYIICSFLIMILMYNIQLDSLYGFNFNLFYYDFFNSFSYIFSQIYDSIAYLLVLPNIMISEIPPDIYFLSLCFLLFFYLPIFFLILLVLMGVIQKSIMLFYKNVVTYIVELLTQNEDPVRMPILTLTCSLISFVVALIKGVLQIMYY